MRRSIVGLVLVPLWLASRSGAPAEEIRSHKLQEPCPTAYRKGGHDCDRLDRMTTAQYNVKVPTCPAGGCALRAGASRVDITPPPGYPMGGNGFPAQFGRGYWSRLYVRAFFFRDSRNQSLALVSCDLGAMSAGLQARVAEILHRKNPDLNLSRDNLILSATHVHQGPGNFMSFKLYNDMGSREKGFDRKLFDILTERIADAVLEAARKAEAAKEKTTLVLRQGEMHRLLRNRAVEPFMLNPDRGAVLSDGPDYPCDPPGPGCPCPEGDPYRKDCPRYRAIDPRISVLEIRREGKPEPAASLVFLSVHPEAMSNVTQLYQSDFTGLAMSLVEKDFNGDDQYGPYVAGFFNGADGDISVRWKKQNRNEAVKFAKSLRRTIRWRLKETLSIGAEATFRLARTELSSNCYFTDYQSLREEYLRGCYAPGGPCIAAKPVYGTATLGGGEDARSPLYDLGFKEGHRKPPRDLQGVKQGALESSFIPNPFNPKHLMNLTEQFGPPCYFPEKIPLSVVNIQSPAGALWLGALPGEPTRTVWWRIEDTLARLAPDGDKILPIGIANEYIGYVATREEYAAQAYEGASTIYGPSTAELLRVVLRDLAGQLRDPVDDSHRRVEAAAFYPEAWCAGNTFGPHREWMQAAHGDDDEALENLIVDRDGKPERRWPRFRWPEPRENDLQGEWEAGARFVEIVDALTNRRYDDERGPNILTVVINPDDPPDDGWKRYHPLSADLLDLVSCGIKPSFTGRQRIWQAIWLGDRHDTTSYYFRVKIKGADKACSKPFSVKEVMDAFSPVVEKGTCPP